MPQLSLNPWFLIFLFSWLFFLIVLPHKLTSYLLNYSPAPKNTEKQKPEPWNWPWS
uniref:ATP synthase complex subunit 8 n=2 Tax=Dipturus TaxID=117858 RepID=A0A0U2DCQ2_9CHON|nr:ATP synthase F0 subunit 8 [Dipturus trachyderma]AHJ61109.1 ATP synthase F0 subunit 8 [Dipturus argentinensis]AKP18574.1 ATPase subunit 8 [Dipturus trachyderma]